MLSVIGPLLLLLLRSTAFAPWCFGYKGCFGAPTPPPKRQNSRKGVGIGPTEFEGGKNSANSMMDDMFYIGKISLG